jgi:surface antigen
MGILLSKGSGLRRAGQRVAAAAALAVLAVATAAGPSHAAVHGAAAKAGSAAGAATKADVGAAAEATGALATPVTTNYPWNGLTYNNGGDQWGMAYGQCVSYAAWMIYQNFGGNQHPPFIPDAGWFPSDGLSKGPVRYSWGNAGDWNVSAANAGFAVNGTPHVGAIAQWVNGSDSGQFTVGHVAYVTAVYSDGSIDLAQFNLREDSKFSTLHMGRGGATDTSNGHGPFFVPWPDHFLHIGDGGIGSSGKPYQVTGADSQGLAIQSQPHVNHVVGWASNGTTLYVVCQTKYGDQVDGRTQYGHPFTTWDKLDDGTWVYDWYMNTPTVATNGYSPGISPCAGG